MFVLISLLIADDLGTLVLSSAQLAELPEEFETGLTCLAPLARCYYLRQASALTLFVG